MTLFFRHIKVVTSSDWNTTSEWRQFCDVILTVIMQRQCDVVSAKVGYGRNLSFHNYFR